MGNETATFLNIRLKNLPLAQALWQAKINVLVAL